MGLFEKVDRCAVCGSEKYRPLFTTKKIVHVVKCLGCGLNYANPRIVQNEFQKMYQTKGYYDTYIIKEEILDRRLFLRRLTAIEQYKKTGRILDIGCATGFFLDGAKSRGWETWGVEISKFASEYARKNFGLDVFTGTLREAKFHGDLFDVIVMDDVIEHVPFPITELEEVYRILKPSGILALNTPNAGGLLRRFMGRKWFHFKEDHLFFFSHKTIKLALEKAGFKVLDIKPSGKLVTLKRLVVRLYHYERAKPLARLLDWIFDEAFFMKWSFFLHTGAMTVYATK